MPPPSVTHFLLLGIEHIFTGYDHLLFLFGLLLVCTRWQSLVLIVTSFTLGHSLTLALATFNLLQPPAALVEPIIAATILFVGAENLWRRGEEPKARWLVTLIFGLVHGFGFASVLRDLGVGRDGDGIALPLLGFNLGVETGQLCFAAIVLPLIWTLRRHPVFVRRWIPGMSVVIALFGLYWLVERLFAA